MIKHSFAILENCFLKLFNLILMVGCVPNIWCKVLITPVHKKGDSSDPDNFLPVCVLSCLCKMLTNCLNKKNKRDIFTIGDNLLENVCQFTYLGVDISASGSLKASMDSLCTKANKAKYALNNIAKLKRIPVKTAIRLFDVAILPILTYGSEVWAFNSTLDYDKWDSCPPEKSPLDFIRHILGTNSSVNNLICRAELGRYPLCIEINCRIVNFYKHIKEIPRIVLPTKLF